jgi:hypothetical protein
MGTNVRRFFFPWQESNEDDDTSGESEASEEDE